MEDYQYLWSLGAELEREAAKNDLSSLNLMVRQNERALKEYLHVW